MFPSCRSIVISPLDIISDKIHVRDIILPAGVTLLTGLEEVVAVVQAAKEEKEETTPVDLSAIEVEKKGKKDEEGEAPEAEAKA